MLHVVTGGSGSGKSAYAEELICRLQQNRVSENQVLQADSEYSNSELIYIATMMPYGEETKKKIEKHRKARAGKGFQTVECYRDLARVCDFNAVNSIGDVHTFNEHSYVLLECMSNLVANEMFADIEKTDGINCKREECISGLVSKIMDGIKGLMETCKNVVIVTNEVFSDGAQDTKEMLEYKKVLGCVNQEMAKMAESVTEVVYGCPMNRKYISGDRLKFCKENSSQDWNKTSMKKDMRNNMNLIVGGAFQGKTEYAMREYPDCEWIDGISCKLNQIETCGGIFHFHEWIRRKMQEQESIELLNDSGLVEQEAAKIVDDIYEKNPNIVIVSDEVGYGLVPIDAFERAYREMVGRICTLLAERAKSVERVTCGIAVTLKNNPQ